MATSITELEARMLLDNLDTEIFPRPHITGAGTQALIDWIDRVAKFPSRQSITAWQYSAESAMSDAGMVEDVTIEMRSFYTLSGNPEVLALQREWFQWVV